MVSLRHKCLKLTKLQSLKDIIKQKIISFLIIFGRLNKLEDIFCSRNLKKDRKFLYLKFFLSLDTSLNKKSSHFISRPPKFRTNWLFAMKTKFMGHFISRPQVIGKNEYQVRFCALNCFPKYTIQNF